MQKKRLYLPWLTTEPGESERTQVALKGKHQDGTPKEADDPNKSVGHKRTGSDREFIGQSEERHWM